MFRDKLIIAGAGGQGALRIGQMIAYAALDNGWEVEWLPSYGAEMRGGTANCNVTISDTEIIFPMIREPDCLIVMNDLSLDKYACSVRPNGVVLIDSSIIKSKIERDDIHTFYVPADEIAEEEGNTRGANMVMLGAYLALTSKVSMKSICDVIDRSFTGSKEKYADSNKRLVKRGFEYIKQLN